MFYDWLGRHPGIFVVIVIIGLAVLFVRSVIRALQRWEVIPDPLLPERWRRAIDTVVQKASGEK